MLEDSNFEKELEKVREEKLSKKDLYDLNILQPKVIKYAMYKMRTEQEVLRRFESEFQDISSKAFDEILKYLKDNNILNDEVFAKTFLEEAIKFKRNSKFELKMKLKEKGVPEEYIYKALDSLEEKLDNYEQDLVFKILNERKNQDRQKVLNYLYRKGFDGINIRNAVEKFEEE